MKRLLLAMIVLCTVVHSITVHTSSIIDTQQTKEDEFQNKEELNNVRDPLVVAAATMGTLIGNTIGNLLEQNKCSFYHPVVTIGLTFAGATIGYYTPSSIYKIINNIQSDQYGKKQSAPSKRMEPAVLDYTRFGIQQTYLPKKSLTIINRAD